MVIQTGRKPSAAPSLFGMALIGGDPLSPPGTTIALASRAKLVTELHSCWYCQNKLLTQDGAAQAQGPCHWQIQTDCFQIPVNALLAQKCSAPSQPIPKRQASSGLCPYFLILYAVKASCHLLLYAGLWMETVYFKKGSSLYHLHCLL